MASTVLAHAGCREVPGEEGELRGIVVEGVAGPGLPESVHIQRQRNLRLHRSVPRSRTDLQPAAILSSCQKGRRLHTAGPDARPAARMGSAIRPGYASCL